ncbi:UNVERIFIED_CONTAM: hypothetical protein FKN15_042647 [Acipenser sinensis]
MLFHLSNNVISFLPGHSNDILGTETFQTTEKCIIYKKQCTDPITALIQFKTLVLAYRCLDQTAPSYLQTLISPYTPTRPLRSACTRKLALPPLRSPASRARSFYSTCRTPLFFPWDTYHPSLNALYLLLSAPYFTAFNPVL